MASDLATTELVKELGDLLENRIPESVRQPLDRGLDFNIERQSFRAIFALREDYLAPLEELCQLIPSLRSNRMRLSRMSGTQAQEAVQRPSPELVDGEVAAVCLLESSAPTAPTPDSAWRPPPPGG